MAMAKAMEAKSDDLEIVSIGMLYNGPWEKKYWSSSRGKDRYPYPVGYQAVRSHNGVTYTTEILEGLKGPFFRITSTDGHSGSGQTPDIAWESFQKKGAVRIKMWHNKRFSCKIDGVEFFGFKNQFVQRLLRELIANVSGTSTSSRTLDAKHQTQCKEPCRQPELLPYGDKPQVTGKRSRKHGVASVKSTDETTLRKFQPQEQTKNTVVSASRSRGQKKYIPKNSSSPPACTNSGNPAASLTTKNVVEEKSFSCSVDSSEHFKKEVVLPQQDSVLICSGNCASISSTIFKEKEPFDRSEVICTQGLSSSKKLKEGDASFQDASQTIKELNLWAPDSLDHELGITPANDMIMESHPEEEMAMSTTHADSEKSDFDSVGQEITKSMMTVLLPRALPLLNTFTRKKKTDQKRSEDSLFKKRSTTKNNKMKYMELSSPTILPNMNVDEIKQQEEVHTGSMVPSCGDMTAIAPDSLDNNPCGRALDNQLLLIPDSVEPDSTTFVEEACTSITLKLPVSVDVLQDSAVCSDARLVINHEHRQPLNEDPQKGDSSISDSVTSPSRKKCKIPGKDSLYSSENHYEQKGVITLPDSFKETNSTTSNELVTEENFVIKTNAGQSGACTGNNSFTQISDVNNLTRQPDRPLSETIVCRNFGDICAPDISAAGNVGVSGKCQLSPSHKWFKQDSNCYEGKLDGQPYKDRNFAFEAAFCDVASVTSERQEFVGKTKPNGPSDMSNPSISHRGTFHACYNKEHLQNQDHVELLEQGESFGNKIKTNKIVKGGSDLTAQTNNQNSDQNKVFEIIGCYIHSMPVSLVLLSTKDDEIYICVLCGSVMDKNWDLFIYRTPIQGQSNKCPSFVGYASVEFPIERDAFGREITLNDGSSLQFTPDGKNLVMLNYVKVPCCRMGKIPCSCPACMSDCFEKNAVKVVKLNPGYISVVTKLKTMDNVRCILVTEPNILLAAEESGKLHLWVMNSTWSSEIDESYLPTSDCTAPYVVELKKIPKCPYLVLGHNGFGEFSLWDISKRINVSSFSAPTTSFSRFFPINLFTLQRKGLGVGLDAKEQLNDSMDVTEKFLERDETHALPVEGKDVAIPILVSAKLDSDSFYCHQSSGIQVNTFGWWRQALLVNNTVISENIMDPRATAVGALAGHGIIGTCDGFVYMCELSTGTILGNLHSFKGSAVSCIAIDDSSSDAFAVAGDCKLRLYLHNKKRRQ